MFPFHPKPNLRILNRTCSFKYKAQLSFSFKNLFFSCEIRDDELDPSFSFIKIRMVMYTQSCDVDSMEI